MTGYDVVTPYFGREALFNPGPERIAATAEAAREVVQILKRSRGRAFVLFTSYKLMQELADLVKRTRAGSLKSSELGEATITVTNLGDQGVELVQGVIYPPQVAIVGYDDLPLADVSERTGFKHQEYLGAVFKARTGQTPADYRKQRRGWGAAHGAA